jgi:outer membrane protein assembly factor BamB
MWRWQGLVIVFPGHNPGPGGWPLLTGLDAATGQVRWTQPVAGNVHWSYPTADGGLAMLCGDDTLEVVDLSSGRVRWTRPAGYPATSSIAGLPMAVVGGAVLFAVNGHLTSYDDRTGQIRWTDALRPIQLAYSLGTLNVQAAAEMVYLTGAVQQRDNEQPAPVLLGISAADGHATWQFQASPTETLGACAPGLISVTSSSGGTWLDELDPATGRVRWQVASACQAIVTPAGIVTAPVTDGKDQISMHDTLTGQTRWTTSLAGLNAGWQQQGQALPVFPAGPLLIVPAAVLAGPELLTAFRISDGDRAWQVTIPGGPSVLSAAGRAGLAGSSVRVSPG